VGKGNNMKKLIAEKEKWENEILSDELKKTGERKANFETASGIPVKRLYSPVDL